MSTNDENPNIKPSDASANGEVEEPTAKFEKDVLVRGWREYEEGHPKATARVKFAAKTDMGQVRENNEDKFEFYEPMAPSILAARGCLYAVSDGIGGAQAGQIASEMLLKHLISGYYDNPSNDLVTALYESIFNANDRIHSLSKMIPERQGMGATLTCLVIIDDRVIVAQVGDSRAYCLREGSIYQITQDHSWVEEQVRAGQISREEAENSPFKNVITRSCGSYPTVVPDFYEEQAKPGDVWILCSDGLTAYVQGEEMAQIVSAHPPSEACRQFIEIANSRGGRDNITVFVIAIQDVTTDIDTDHACAVSADTPLAASVLNIESHPNETYDAAAPTLPISTSGNQVGVKKFNWLKSIGLK